MADVERLFWRLGTRFRGQCHCREVEKELMCTWTVCLVKKIGRCREVAISRGLTVVLKLINNSKLS